ncbi:hypothetical protein [Arsenicicoccus dermatophilus]|uniref:hypothetical protein n=1 Tax=Arsenicicoccus dermatophilus TaxID=1076331 RepID=UPI00391715C9
MTVPPPPRRRGVPLGERPAGGAGGPLEGGELRAPRQRMVWVAAVDGAQEQPRHPGLAHAWRRRGDGSWQVRCTYLVEDGSVEGVTVTQWLAAELVTPLTEV